jgi:hypothetical protein
MATSSHHESTLIVCRVPLTTLSQWRRESGVGHRHFSREIFGVSHRSTQSNNLERFPKNVFQAQVHTQPGTEAHNTRSSSECTRVWLRVSTTCRLGCQKAFRPLAVWRIPPPNALLVGHGPTGRRPNTERFYSEHLKQGSIPLY